MAPSKSEQKITIPYANRLGLLTHPEDPTPTAHSWFTRQAENNQVYQIVDDILRIADELVSLPDLKPCSRVNALFGRLVDICVKPWNSRVSRVVLENRRLKALTPMLREVCAVGEGNLEREWAGRILAETLMEKYREVDCADEEAKGLSEQYPERILPTILILLSNSTRTPKVIPLL